jgi:hypothetical protein
LKSPEEMGYWGGGTGTDVDHVTTPFWDWDSLLGWMCACYRRFLAISQLLFQDKRKHEQKVTFLFMSLILLMLLLILSLPHLLYHYHHHHHLSHHTILLLLVNKRF